MSALRALCAEPKLAGPCSRPTGGGEGGWPLYPRRFVEVLAKPGSSRRSRQMTEVAQLRLEVFAYVANRTAFVEWQKNVGRQPATAVA